jgi:hypothetical protein
MRKPTTIFIENETPRFCQGSQVRTSKLWHLGWVGLKAPVAFIVEYSTVQKSLPYSSLSLLENVISVSIIGGLNETVQLNSEIGSHLFCAPDN